MRIGDTVFVHGIVDEIRNDTVIIRNNGGYFGTVAGEIITGDMPKREKGKWIDAVLPNDNGGLPVQVCDQCNTFFPLAYTGGGHRFCPECGADMRGDDHDL